MTNAEFAVIINSSKQQRQNKRFHRIGSENKLTAGLKSKRNDEKIEAYNQADGGQKGRQKIEEVRSNGQIGRRIQKI